jgi:16S rRNA (cytidine1402-2'-O)-methyltransferase
VNSSPEDSRGVLAIVATPIGNLEDLTLRAARTLREADIIACEDTRQTRKLLAHYGISKPLVSYHEHNERQRSGELLDELAKGRTIALVSDAGTPLIADPGYRLVAQARERGFQVTPIPGPSALIAALSASGLPTDAFLFHGFLPAKTIARRTLLEQLKSLPATLVFYETPHRILDALEDIAAILDSRTVALGREITKTFEEFLTGPAAELREKLAARPSIKGEFVVMIAKGEAREQETTSLAEAVAELIGQGVPRMEALKQVARRRGLSKREVYKSLQG